MEFRFRKRPLAPSFPRFEIIESGQTKTYDDFIRRVLSIEDPRDAASYFALAVTWYARHFAVAIPAAEQEIRQWIGWCFGEGMSEPDQEMWVQVCGASHPVWGQRRISNEEAFRLGLVEGERRRRESDLVGSRGESRSGV